MSKIPGFADSTVLVSGQVRVVGAACVELPFNYTACRWILTNFDAACTDKVTIHYTVAIERAIPFLSMTNMIYKEPTDLFEHGARVVHAHGRSTVQPNKVSSLRRLECH